MKFGAVGLAVLLLSSAAQAADYSKLGPEATSEGTLTPNGGATSGVLVVPTGKGPYPLLVASHGFSASSDNQLGWARHFASWGFVVAVPTFPNSLFPDHKVNAGIVASLVQLYADPKTASKAQGKVDGTRIGLEGHSAGGLATTLAVATVKPGAVVLFDPVDDQAADGKTAYAAVCEPVLGLFAGPSSCNNNAGWSAFKSTAAGPLVTADVVGSNHCDGENLPRALCSTFCGTGGQGADAKRQSVYARYATAFFLANLKNDPAAQADLAAASKDPQLANVAAKSGPSCVAPPSDAGAPPVDASVPVSGDASAPASDASTPVTPASDGGVTPDAPTSTGSSQPGCSCVVGSGERGAGAAWLLLIGAIVAVTRRRHARG